MFKIKVPASTANLGPGFDSIGLALGLYLQVDVYPSESWEIIHLSKELEIFPQDGSHFICRIAMETAAEFGKKLEPCKLVISSEIPLTRGLGSSASAIVAGIELADAIGGLNLTRDDKVRISSKYEGHPDNAGASVCGGLVVGVHGDGDTELVSFPVEDIRVIAVIPEHELPTEESRNVLPEELSFRHSVKASAVSNTFLAAFLSKNYDLAGRMMKQDLFHQPFRRNLVPHMERIEHAAREAGAFGSALSGAGPTIICLAESDKASSAALFLARRFPEYTVTVLDIDNKGSIVERTDSPLSLHER
ncbi:homoserine kinase [Peribacillus deserti]|uniref:Homoserine kinase n=1 Tax=Peribacillus deserti TaxID=673318 RepID=A0A2N5M7N3_9BACI|nr:homoserine kinase [Peribacillus deserti]PLT30357.1 homoserine kinase [Peribacillus deserti]